MKTLLMGAGGFVGSAFSRYFEKNDIPYTPIGRKEMDKSLGTSCDLMILSCGNANKGKGIADPMFDFSQSLANIAHYVHGVEAKRVLLISSVDVYNDPSTQALTSEDTIITPHQLHSYGFHKYLAEQYVQKYSQHYMIMRLPGLVGPGLQKNAVYDHCHPPKKLFLSPESQINFVHTDAVAKDGMNILMKESEPLILNYAATDSLTIKDMGEITNTACRYHDGADENIQMYDINTRLAARYCDLKPSACAVEQYVTEDM